MALSIFFSLFLLTPKVEWERHALAEMKYGEGPKRREKAAYNVKSCRS